MADCCLIKKVATVEVYENKNEVRAYGFMVGDRNTPIMEVRFKHLWGEDNLSGCKLRWIIVDDVGSLLVGEVPIREDNTASINLPNELFTGERRMKVQLTVASCDGGRILNLQQFTDLKVINNLATNEVVEPVYNILINTLYDESQKYLKELEISYTEKYGGLENLYLTAKSSLEEYLVNAENGGNAEFLQGYVPFNFNRVENTMAELQASSKYKLGDVVEVLGYYTAGDGANHKREIENADDGSGVQLANGLWANIVHNGEVNVSWFGAKGDGVTDDTVAIHSTHNYATKSNSNTKYKRGVYLINCGKGLSSVISNQIDYCGSTLVFQIPENYFKPIFKTEAKNYTPIDFSSSVINKNINNHIMFSPHELKFIKISGNCKSVNNTDMLLSECVFSTSGGCIIGRPSVHRLGQETEVLYRDMTPSLELKNLKIKEVFIGGTPIIERFNYKLFDIQDTDNITLQNITNTNNGFVASRSGFYFYRCYNIMIQNVNNSGYTKLGTEQGVNSAWGYLFNFEECVKVNLYNYVSPHSNEMDWSTLGMNNCKVVHYENCVMFSPDQHSLVQDLSVRDSTISRSVLSGDGYRIFENVVFDFANPYAGKSMFTFRGQSVTGNYNSFEGDVYVKNCTLKIPSYSIGGVFELLDFNYKNNDQNTSLSDKFFDNFTVDNLKVVTSKRDNTPKFRFFNIESNSNRRFFKSLRIANSDFDNITMLVSGKNNADISINHYTECKRLDNGYPLKPSMCVTFENVIFPSNYKDAVENRRGFQYAQYEDSPSFNTEVVEVTYVRCKNIANVFASCGILKIQDSEITNLYIGGGVQNTRKNKVIINNSQMKDWVTLNIPNGSCFESRKLCISKNTKIDTTTGGYFSELSVVIPLIDLRSAQSNYNSIYGNTVDLMVDTLQQLNTPYHATKMQQEGILDEYYQYLDDKNAYDQRQKELETQRQLAFENREDKNQTYEEWLSTQPMMLPVETEPQPSEALLKFKEKYLG